MIIKLEDGNNYYVTKEITDGNIIYVYLTNINDVTDFCVRKTDVTKKNLNPLDDEAEFNKAMDLLQDSINK